MAIKIGSNIASLQAQRRLGEATSSLERVYERLSSGQRINRASDDAAGLAISERLNADSKVFTQGIRNINDSLSLFAIAEQAANSLKSIIVRSKELAEQSANGVYSSVQRSALNNELQSLGNEYNRILQTTEFNGKNIFTDNQIVTQTGNSQLVSSLSNQRAIELTQIARVSVGYDGAEANGSSSSNLFSRSVINYDGRYVLFESTASNLIANDTNGTTADIFLQDQRTGEITLISSSATGQQGNANSVITQSSMSADGKYVVFSSVASNLVSGDTNGFFDIYLKNVETGEISRISTSSSGTQANGNSTHFASISADGRYAVFQSNSTNLVSTDTSSNNDIFRKDLITGELVHVSTSNSGGQNNGTSSATASISSDGRYITFITNATDILVSDGNGTTADLVRKDMLTGEVVLVSSSSSGQQADAGPSSPHMSADGRYVVFSSTATNLVAGDTNGLQDVFRKDLLTGETVMVSSSSSGVIASGGTSTGASISADGRYVVFESSANNLVTGDTNSASDIFIKDMQTGEVKRLNLSESQDQASTGSSPTATRSVISSDGKYISFRSSFTDQLDGTPSTAGRSHSYITSNGFDEVYQLAKFQWMDINTQYEARKTLSWLGKYEEELDNYIGQIGATTSRLTTASTLLAVTRENYLTAEARIKDADIAAESANLVRTQILQQAATSVLTQANAQPGIALSLLKQI